MAPKTKSTGSKRKEGEGSSRASAPFDASRFRSAHHAARYQELLKRKFLHEKQFIINPQGKYTGILGIFESRKWETLVSPPTNINADIVREFYANAIPDDPEDPFEFQTFVRGHVVKFHRPAINAYLGNPLTPVESEYLCEYHTQQARGNWDHEEIKKAIFKEGKDYDLNASGRPFRAFKQDMTMPAQVILNLILHNIRPKSHMSSTTLDVTPLIYCILAGKKVDVARIIAKELKTVAMSGITTAKCPLAFPGLIMGLCQTARIVLPPQIHEQIVNPVDDAYIARHNEGRQVRRTHHQTQDQPESSQAQEQPPTQPQQPQIHQWDPRYQSFTWDAMEAHYRGQLGIQESLYRMQQHWGAPSDSAQQVMTPDQYRSYVNYPGDRPFYYGGGSGAGAAVADDDDAVAADDDVVAAEGSDEETASDEEMED